MTARIAVLPGDGIGPEVTEAALRVLRAIGRRFARQFVFDHRPIGGAALRAGLPPLPDESLDACLESDAVLLGAVGDPAFDDRPSGSRPETGLLRLRRELGVFANLRPVRVWAGLERASPLRPDRVTGLDLLIVRELTGGLYFGEPRGESVDHCEAFNTMRYSSSEVERVAAIALRLAATRRGHVVSVDKANVLETSRLWRATVARVASSHETVRVEHQYVDSCALALVLEPRRYDVILTENLFGDILSDQAGGLAGSLGLLPSASLGNGPGLYEPVHGSAPSLAGTDTANPAGAILSAAMMLRYSLGAEREARVVEDAVHETLVAGCCTPDLACALGIPPSRCSEVSSEVVARIAGS